MTIGQTLHGFEIIGIEDLPELGGSGIYARHLVTGLEVFHLHTDDEENLFAYAFMTPPEDSTGVAHILEHSVLCGSEHYPLKDPFLVLTKQSVKTFLNAMTFPDKTVYPASSMVEKDYFNLMSVYGDAVFFPNLDEWVFRQEGHRFEFDADGKVSIQGVVFNEMKGNYSTFDSVAGDWSLFSILGGTPYAHDSGGDPADIPALSYEQFRAFHARYYHPANCRVFLSGNIDTARQLELLQSKFLYRFAPEQKPVFDSSITRFTQPTVLEVPAPAGNEQDPDKVTVMLNWLLPDSTDTVALMEANLVTEILLGHDGSPLSRALLESALGEDIAPSSGLETEILHMCFSAGLRGVPRGSAEKVQDLIMGTLSALERDGVTAEDVETAVRSIEFSNREIRRSGGPFALTLMRRSLRGWIHGFGPAATLRYVPAFEEVKRRLAADPAYISGLIRTWFTGNPHRALVMVYPDTEYEKRLEDTFAARIRLFESGLTAESKKVFLEEQERFFARQKEVDSPELLTRIPHLSREDLSVIADRIETRFERSGSVPVLLHEQPTNGIAYADIAVPVDILPAGDYSLLPFFSSALTGMGLDGLSWIETSALSARLTGGLGVMLFTSSVVPGTVAGGLPGDGAIGRDCLILRVKMLEELIPDALALAFRFLTSADFSDTKRLADILLEFRNDLDSSLAPAGNQYAVSRAACGTGLSKAVDEIWNGLTQVRSMREFAKQIRKGGEAEAMALRLDGMRKKLLSAGMVINCTGTAPILGKLLEVLAPLTAPYKAPEPLAATYRNPADFYREAGVEKHNGSFRELDSAALQVGFAACVLPSPQYGSADQPVDIVFGNWLSKGLLWEKIRTAGGAYGAFAYPDSLEDIFILASYRDPSPLNSIEAFRESLEIAASTLMDPLDLEKTIIGCYSSEVQPRAPSDKGFTSFIRILYGITDDVRRNKIARILAVTPEDMQKCARRLLGDWKGVRQAVLAGKKQLKESSKTEFSGVTVRLTI